MFDVGNRLLSNGNAERASEYFNYLDDKMSEKCPEVLTDKTGGMQKLWIDVKYKQAMSWSSMGMIKEADMKFKEARNIDYMLNRAKLDEYNE